MVSLFWLERIQISRVAKLCFCFCLQPASLEKVRWTSEQKVNNQNRNAGGEPPFNVLKIIWDIDCEIGTAK